MAAAARTAGGVPGFRPARSGVATRPPGGRPGWHAGPTGLRGRGRNRGFRRPAGRPTGGVGGPSRRLADQLRAGGGDGSGGSAGHGIERPGPFGTRTSGLSGAGLSALGRHVGTGPARRPLHKSNTWRRGECRCRSRCPWTWRFHAS